jgi:hypothetical protein
MRPVETIPGGGQRRMMEGWIQLWYSVRNFVNITMYPQHNNNKSKLFFKKEENLLWFLFCSFRIISLLDTHLSMLICT